MRVIHILAHSLEPFCQPLSSPTDWEHVEHHVVTFITNLKQADPTITHELWVLSNTLKKPATFQHQQGFTIRVFPRDLPLPLPLETSRSLLRAVKTATQENQSTIWHLHSYYLAMYDFLALALRYYNQRFVAHFRGGSFTWRALPYSVYHYGLMLPLTLRLANHIFVQNKREIQRLQSIYGISPQRITWLPNSFANPFLLTPKTQETAVVRIIYVGRLLAYKGVAEIAQTVATLRAQGLNCTLTLVGDGPLLMELKKSYNEPWLKLPGQVNKKKVFELVSQSDIFVLGTTKKEGSPQSLIETQGLGLPAVAFRREGIEDIIIHNQTGFLAEAWPEFQDYLHLLIQQPKLRQQFGQAAEENIENIFSTEQLTEIVLKRYQKVTLE